jgi:sulfatase maturation enzyme AslB (radical SAM superfamily)
LHSEKLPDTIGSMNKKFSTPHLTAKNEPRAYVTPRGYETIWFNTGTLCNIECANCYIESSPKNDALVYITAQEVRTYFNEISSHPEWPVQEIGLTGGEPFMNPDILEIMQDSLNRGYKVLVLTNAMRPLMRPKIQQGLLALKHKESLTLRVSLDYYSAELHDQERGAGSFEIALKGMRWLSENGFTLSVAGRKIWGDTEGNTRSGYAKLFTEENFKIDAMNPAETVLFPEMDERDVPEITTACWDILNKSPQDIMCANARMVVKRKGEENPKVLACTLLPYEKEFELGETLAQAHRPVFLNHRYCAQFCVLGGASCSA